jgi:hypothetical protein
LAPLSIYNNILTNNQKIEKQKINFFNKKCMVFTIHLLYSFLLVFLGSSSCSIVVDASTSGPITFGSFGPLLLLTTTAIAIIVTTITIVPQITIIMIVVLSNLFASFSLSFALSLSFSFSFSSSFLSFSFSSSVLYFSFNLKSSFK